MAAFVDAALVLALTLVVGWVTFQVQPEPTPGKFSGVPRALNTLGAALAAGGITSLVNEVGAVLRAGVSLGLWSTGLQVPVGARRGPALLVRWGVTWVLPPMLFLMLATFGLRTVAIVPDPAMLPGPLAGIAAGLLSTVLAVGTAAIVAGPLLVVVHGRTLGDRVVAITPVRRP